MKKEIHPGYFDTSITCACGNVIKTRSTVKDIKVEVCSACHNFFTGQHKFVDTAGRVEKFQKKYGKNAIPFSTPKNRPGKEAAKATSK